MKVIDSDHCVAILRGQLDLRQKATGVEDTLAVTTISVGELAHGAYKSARTAENLLKLDILLSQLLVIPYDEEAARRFGALKADLGRGGTIIGDLDLQIASVALVRNAPLVTHNQQHFDRIPDLKIEDWIR
jgi:tRNA(fMet)-specific endonuclease VapC